VLLNEQGDNESKALWIKFRGREWVILWHDSVFNAVPSDSMPVYPQQIEQLRSYLIKRPNREKTKHTIK
jgi:hypothetical protein